MIRRIILIFLIGFIFLNFCFSQKGIVSGRSILFRGVILDASSQNRLGGSQILINRSFYGISAEDGTFSFYADKRDTIIFSMMGYKTTSLIVSDTLSGPEFLTGVYLETDTIFIGEVIIVPKFTSLKAEMLNPGITSDPRFDNARSNISIATYQGKTNQGSLGDPRLNYEMLRQQYKVNAYERGGIPSDKIAGISPLLLIPAVYLLLHGVPEKPPPPKPQISSKDIEELNRRFLESLDKKR